MKSSFSINLKKTTIRVIIAALFLFLFRLLWLESIKDVPMENISFIFRVSSIFILAIYLSKIIERKYRKWDRLSKDDLNRLRIYRISIFALILIMFVNLLILELLPLKIIIESAIILLLTQVRVAERKGVIMR